MTRTVAQPTPAPTRKMLHSGLTGLGALLVVWAAGHWFGLDLTEAQAATVVAGLAWAAGYATKERRARTDMLAENARHRYPLAQRRPPDDTGLT